MKINFARLLTSVMCFRSGRKQKILISEAADKAEDPIYRHRDPLCVLLFQENGRRRSRFPIKNRLRSSAAALICGTGTLQARRRRRLVLGNSTLPLSLLCSAALSRKGKSLKNPPTSPSPASLVKLLSNPGIKRSNETKGAARCATLIFSGLRGLQHAEP